MIKEIAINLFWIFISILLVFLTAELIYNNIRQIIFKIWYNKFDNIDKNIKKDTEK